MAKVVIELNYRKYVVDAKEALIVAEMLSKAEVYESKYTKDSEGNSITTHHVYDVDQDSPNWYMNIMPESVYRIGKLAGKPPEDK